MRRSRYRSRAVVKQPVSQLPWSHIVRLIQMVKDSSVREFYIRETLAHGCSRSILEIQIQKQLHFRSNPLLFVGHPKDGVRQPA